MLTENQDLRSLKSYQHRIFVADDHQKHDILGVTSAKKLKLQEGIEPSTIYDTEPSILPRIFSDKTKLTGNTVDITENHQLLPSELYQK